MTTVEKIKACYLKREALEGFEKNFIEDNHARVTKFGDQTHFSEKQTRIIDRIHRERIVEGKPYTKPAEKAEA